MLKTDNERFESEVFKHLKEVEGSASMNIYKSVLAESIFLKEFDCEPAYRSETSHLDFRFLLRKNNSVNCFAIKIRNKELTFYFRAPVIDFVNNNKEEIFKNLPELQERMGEYFIVLKDINTWRQVLQYIQLYKA